MGKLFLQWGLTYFAAFSSWELGGEIVMVYRKFPERFFLAEEFLSHQTKENQDSHTGS